jgi:polysaccharide biosynthesis transport protein
LLNKVPAEPIEYTEDVGGAQAPSIDFFAILAAVLRRWKLVAAITLSASIATYGVVKLLAPSRYQSTVEILVYDPQRQIDSTVQKPISPFVDAVGDNLMNTEIKILKSKSVALRVVRELGLDTDPEFQSHKLRIGDLVDRLRIADLAKRLGIADLGERLGFPGLGRASNNSAETIDGTEEKAEKLDRAADALLKGLDISQDSYVITVSTTSRDPIKAQRLASTIANDYLATQREARQEALEHVATWLKGRVDDLQSKVLETESSIEKLKLESGVRDDTETDNVKEQQISSLNFQLTTAREEVNDKRARLEQARHVIETNGDLDSIPELSAATELAELRPTLNELQGRKLDLNMRAAELQNKLGERNVQVISIRAQLAAVNKQIDAEAGHILSNMKNAYDIAVGREQSLEANLQSLTANLHSETSIKLQELRRVADADRKVYESYLSQYNDIAERRELQDASARIISPATLPRSPSSSRAKFYALGGMAGLAGGLLLAFLLEYFRPGVKTGKEIEQSFGLPVVGNIPSVWREKTRGVSYRRPLDRMVGEPLSHLSEAVRAMRISLELSSANPKVILITSALPGEGKSTAAMLLAASSASSGKRTILLDCDLRLRSTSEALRNKHQTGLSELLRGTAKLTDVIAQDPRTKIYLLPAGSMAPNAADLLMSKRMVDLIAVLRSEFDYIVMDAPPLLPVVDALALATVADKILVIVEWCQTSRASIYEAFRVLGPEVTRIAGIVLNKVDFSQLPGYGAGYHYRSVAKYFSNA